jgi:tetratricopeptide (TPR) repeat protein
LRKIALKYFTLYPYFSFEVIFINQRLLVRLLAARTILGRRDSMRRALLAVMLLLFCGIAATVEAEEGLLASGIKEYQEENYEEAVVTLQEARAKEPGSAQAAYYLGLAQYQTGSEQEAVLNLKMALTLSPPAKEAAVTLVNILNSQDDRQEAAKWIAWAEKEQVSPADIAYQKGILLDRQGESDAAIKAFASAAKADSSYTQQSNLQIAGVHAKELDADEAVKSLQAVITSDPTSEMAEFARDLEKKLTTREGFKKWRFFGGITYQYDDNVVLSPSTTITGLQFPGKRDSSFSENAQIQYNAETLGRWQFSSQYSINNNNYFEIDTFNQFAQTLSLIPSYRRPKVTYSSPVTVSHSLLDYKNYLVSVSVKPTASIVLASDQIAQVAFGYTRKEFLQDPSSADENRDANVYNGLFSYMYIFGNGKSVLTLRYEPSYEDAAGNNWTNFGNRLAIDLILPVMDKTFAILSGEGMWQNYLNASTVTLAPGVKREDSIYSASVTLSRECMEGLFVNLIYNHTTANSNIAVYDYDRNVVSLGVEYRY